MKVNKYTVALFDRTLKDVMDTISRHRSLDVLSHAVDDFSVCAGNDMSTCCLVSDVLGRCVEYGHCENTIC